MKNDSKHFDRIRIKPRNHQEPQAKKPPCDWEGCDLPGTYRAPKGSRAVGEYHHFCLQHVRHYNNAFNFFDGMSNEEMESHMRRFSETDGRPSWGFGSKADTNTPRRPRNTNPEGRRGMADPLNIFARYTWQQSKGTKTREKVRPLHEPDRRAFEALGLKGQAPATEIRTAYKSLVKVHHPDANGGDKASEEKLRGIIAAYSHLKARGFVGK